MKFFIQKLGIFAIAAITSFSACATDKRSDEVAANTIPGSYEEYAEDKALGNNKQTILFFHASWCPTCKVAQADILDNQDTIPENLIIFKADYDKESELKRKYGVTIQHTFVEIDDQGERVQKWSGGGLKTILQKTGNST